MDSIPALLWIVATFTLCCVAFDAGRNTVKFPDEETMLRRLIEAEANRRISKRTATEIKADIDTAAEKLAGQ